MSYTHWRRSGWNCRRSFVVGTPAEFWSVVYDLCRGRVTLFAVSPCGWDDLTLCDVGKELDSGRLKLWTTPECPATRIKASTGEEKGFKGRFYCGNPPDVLYALTPHGPVRAVGLKNYVPSSLATLARRLGIPHRPTGPDEPRTLIRGWSAEQAQMTTEGTIHGLLNWWRYGECGPWRDTTPQLALSLFKSKYLSHRLLVHADDEARRIEREAAFGPRQSVWFYGDIGTGRRPARDEQPPPDPESYDPHPGPCYRVDVRSQYPHLMSMHPFPSVLMGTRGETDPREVNDLLALWGIVASVQLQTTRAEYPQRKDGLTCYPTGVFTTTLAGPELRRAFDEGAVKRVWRFARYELKPVFRDYARFLWDRRREYRDKGDDGGELWAKLMGNSFAGKLMQRPGRWKSAPNTLPRKRWGYTLVKRADTGTWFAERGIAGQREVWDETAEGQPIAPAAFAYLTAYSRCQMRELRERLSPKDVFAQHTDCLWITEAGMEKLTELDLIQPDQLGGLRPSKPVSYMRFLSPSHRYADGRWTAGGIAEGFHVMKHCRFHVTMTLNANRGKDVRRSALVKERNTVKELLHVKRPSGVGSDGWAVPWHYHSAPDPTGPAPLKLAGPS